MKDIEYNLSQWKKGNNNVLLITGVSGSGKSTTAYNLANDNKAIVISLDLFEHNNYVFDKPENKISEGMYIIKVYFTKTYGGKKDWSNTSDEIYRKEQIKFVKYILSYSKKHTDQLFIIEGLQIGYLGQYLMDEFKNRPCIIKGTSIPKSMIQRMKRDNNIFNNKSPYEFIKWYFNTKDSIKNFNKDYNEKSTVLKEKSVMTYNTILPCFTPKEMEELGVFSNIAEENHYNVVTDHKYIDDYLYYKSTGEVLPEYYLELREAYEKYMKDKSDINKQSLLELGWNPEVNLNDKAIIESSKLTKIRLESDGYKSLEIIDLTK